MKKILVIFFLFSIFSGKCQSFFESDTVLNRKRVAWSSAAIGAGYSGSMITLQNVWYKEHWSKLSFFNDAKEWLGMDKFGHVYTSNVLTKNISSIYNWGGVKREKSLLIGSSVAFLYQTTLEVLDGFSDQWGFSWSDVGANTLGIAWFAWQEMLWQEQRFKLKFSAYFSPYAQYRPNVLGGNFAERILKDYNGQTYWISVTPKQFFSASSNFPKWLSFSFGYRIDQKLHGEENEYSLTTPDGNVLTFHAKRQFLFSLDIDFEQFNPRKKWVKTLFKAINHLKVPFPSLILTGKEMSLHPFYF